MRDNEYDIRLLLNDPNAFIEEHQKTIQYVVNKFVYSGFFCYDDRDEVVQYVNEKLLTDKIGKMQQQYRPNYFVVTYLSKIVHNLCLEYSRKQQTQFREDTSIDISMLEVSNNENASDKIVIEEESRRLDTILKLYHKNRDRTEILLRIYFGADITAADICGVYPQASNLEVENLLLKCVPISDQDNKTDKELYEALTVFLNKYENKRNTSDALRKWVNSKISEIIDLMNGKPKTANYDKETLKILFQFKYKNLHFGEVK